MWIFSIPGWLNAFILGVFVGGFLGWHVATKWENCRDSWNWFTCAYSTARHPF